MKDLKLKAFLKKERIIVDVLEWYCNGRVGVSISDSGPFIKQPEEIELLEFTGLKDLSGQNIYGGYIVKSLIHNPPIFLVEYLEGGFCCTYKDCFPTDINHFYSSQGCSLEIIGNIYQNPELLE